MLFCPLKYEVHKGEVMESVRYRKHGVSINALGKSVINRENETKDKNIPYV